jgi:hypothetical protein
LKAACKYFGVPQTKSGPLYWRIADTGPSKSSSQTDSKDEAKGYKSDKQSYSDTVSDIVNQALEGVKKEKSPSTLDKNKMSQKAESIVRGSLSGAFMDILHVHANEKLKSNIQTDSVGNVVVKGKENGADVGEDTSSSQDDVPASCRQAKKKGNLDEFANRYVEHVMGNAMKDDDDAFRNEDGDIASPISAAHLRSKFGRTDSVDRYGDDDDDEEDITDLMDDAVEHDAEELVDEMDIGGTEGSYRSGSNEGVYTEKLVDNLKQKDVIFVFERQKLTDGKVSRIVCFLSEVESDSLISIHVPLQQLHFPR